MEVREIKTLLALMQDYELLELEIEDKKGKVRLVRAATSPDGAVSAPKTQITARPSAKSAKPTSAAAAGAPASTPSTAPELAANQKLVESPMVGTFYRSASPDAPPFVEEGDSVRKGQPLCIIEAMKMMNEIEAPAAGRVVKVLCENAQPVEYGQALMVLEVG